MESLVFVEAAVFAAMLQFIFHRLPWQEVTERPRPPRLIGYVLGVVGIGISFAWGILQKTSWASPDVLLMFAGVVVGAGIGTITGYGMDKVVGWANKSRFLKRQVDLLETQLESFYVPENDGQPRK